MSFLTVSNSVGNPSPSASPDAALVASPPALIGPVASPSASDAVCDSEGFYQHLGECWNDSIQMIFLFSDGLKEIVQPALLDPNFNSKMESIINHADNKDLFLFNSDLENLKAINIDAANNVGTLLLSRMVNERKNAIIEYFKVLKKRFMRHYTNEYLRRDGVCDEETINDHHTFQTMIKLSRAAGQDGIRAAALGKLQSQGLNRSHINIEELRKKRKEKKYSPGGTIIDDMYLFELYNLVFFFDKYKFSYKVVDDHHKRDIYEKPVVYIDLDISKDVIQNSKAVFITSGVYSYEINEKTKEKILAYKEGHATAFYTCGTSEIYYEDSSGIYPFPWKKFLLMLVDLYKNDKTTILIYGNNTQTGNLFEVQRSSYYPIIRTTPLNDSKNLNEEKKNTLYTYYTFINDSPLLESKYGYFDYNGVSISVPDENIRSTDELIFMTINNDQSVNAQRFNHTARHPLINIQYFYKLVRQPDPDSEKILKFVSKYIVDKDLLSTLITIALRNFYPVNPELNNELLKLAETHLGQTKMEELRKEIAPPWSKNNTLSYDYLQKLISANDVEGILYVLNEYINSKMFDKRRLHFLIDNIIYQFNPINSELNTKLVELAEAHLDPIDVEEVKKDLERRILDSKAGGFRKKRKTRYQKRLIKRKTQKKRRSRR